MLKLTEVHSSAACASSHMNVFFTPHCCCLLHSKTHECIRIMREGINSHQNININIAQTTTQLYAF